MHKEIKTQHQWRFIAVKVDSMFPLGCKTTFRAYSSDQVVEFIKKPKSQCISKVGRYTGLECVTLYCRWYPSPECDKNRIGVEGFYLLTKLPVASVGIGTRMEPCPFVTGSFDDIKLCMLEVNQLWAAFDTHAGKLRLWKKWYEEYAPHSDNAQDYISDRRTQMLYDMPMKVILFQPEKYMSPESWIRKVGVYEDFDPNFKWPESVAIATNSVASDQFNPHPSVPRIYSTLDEYIILKKQFFCNRTALFYEVKLKAETGKFLKDFLARRIGYSGEEGSSTGI